MALCLKAGVCAAALVSSAAPFELQRAGDAIPGLPGQQTLFSEGDTVRAIEASVQGEFPNGNSFLLDEGSEAALAPGGVLELRTGALIAGQRGEERLQLAFDDLLIAQVPASQPNGTVFMGRTATGDLQLSVVEGTFAVTNSATATGVAVVGRGDSLLLSQSSSSGWVPATAQASAPSFKGLDLIQVGALNEDVEKAVIFWWSDESAIIGAGALLAVGGGYIIDEHNEGGGSDDSEESGGQGGGDPQEPFSPI
jgi:hypothetical protein